MKTYIKCCIIKFLAKFGYEFMRIKAKGIHNTFNVLPLIVHDYVAKRKDSREFVCVQIGSNDGKTGDPLYPLIKQYPSWRVVFVEPNPESFNKLCNLYPNRPELTFVNAAISNLTGYVNLYITTNDDRNSSIKLDTAKIGNHSNKEPLKTIKVRSYTLPSLFYLYAIDHINLFHVDAEGYDFKIMMQLLKATYFPPAVIQFEHALMSLTEYDELCYLLSSMQYDLISVGIDTIAVRKSSC